MATVEDAEVASVFGDAMRHVRGGLPNPITVFFSDRRTIKPTPKTHKPADSCVPVGNDARSCSFQEIYQGGDSATVFR